MCATDLDLDLDLTEPEPEPEPEPEHKRVAGDHRTQGRHPGVAWGRLTERRDGQDDLDGQDVAKPSAVPSR
jgi:hypothetical protein